MTDATTLHAFLKSASMARHEQTEAVMGEIGLSTLPGYVSFLQVQAAGVGALEGALSPFAAELGQRGVGWTSRSGALRSDLQAFGVEAQLLDAPELTGLEQAIGAAYTLEGSRLGNAMMFRQFQASHPDMAACGSAFLGFPTAPGFWRQFTDALNVAVPERDRWADVLSGSVLGFDTFARAAPPAPCADTTGPGAGRIEP